MNLIGTVLGLVMALTPPTGASQAEVKPVCPEISPCAIVLEQDVRAGYEIVDNNGVQTYQANPVVVNDKSIPTRPYSTTNTTYPSPTSPSQTRSGNYVRGSVNNNGVVARNSNVTYKNGSSNTNANSMKNSNSTYQNGVVNDNYVAKNKPRTLNLTERDYASFNLAGENSVRNEILSYHTKIAEHKSEIDMLRAKCRAKVREYEDSLYKNSAQNTYLKSDYDYTVYAR